MGLNYINTADINKGIAKNPHSFVTMSERVYFDQIMTAAEKIRVHSSDKPVVLLSGPSGSGKTTSAIRIAKKLAEKGIKTRAIGMDNYFLPKDMGEMPLDEQGNIDLESPLRLDIPLFKEHLEKLIEGEKIDVPTFDFANQSRSGSTPFCREKNEIIIIEGIHALNPMVTGDNINTSCVYVSVRTRIKSTDGEILHPQSIRLMRRLSRDSLFRGRAFKDIFAMFQSVSRGEDLYIMPHKHRATIEVDTFLAHEAPVYKAKLLDGLLKAEETMREFDDYHALIKVLSELTPLEDSELINSESLIREFIGGSSLEY